MKTKKYHAELDPAEWDFADHMANADEQEKLAWCIWELARQVRVLREQSLSECFLPENLGKDFLTKFRCADQISWQLILAFAEANDHEHRTEVDGKYYPRPWLNLSKDRRDAFKKHILPEYWTIRSIKNGADATNALHMLKASWFRVGDDSSSAPRLDKILVEIDLQTRSKMRHEDFRRLGEQLAKQALGASKSPGRGGYESHLHALSKLRLALHFQGIRRVPTNLSKTHRTDGDLRDSWQRPCQNVMKLLGNLFPKHKEPASWMTTIRPD